MATDWTLVSAGYSHTCAVKTSGTLWCWGANQQGQIGNGGDAFPVTTPVQEFTKANDWALLAAGFQHTCALKADGTRSCWGWNKAGQLGDGTTTPAHVPL